MSDHSQNNRRIARNTVVLYVRLALSIVIGLYTSRVIIRVLGVDDFGIYGEVGGIVAMLGFVNAAMTSSTSRNLTYYLGLGDMTSLRRCFGVGLSIHALIALVMIGVGETLGLYFLSVQLQIPPDRMTAAHVAYQLSLLTSFFSIMIVPYNAAIVANERMTAFAYIAIAEMLLKLGIVFLLEAVPYDKLIVYAALYLTVQVVLLATYLVYCTRVMPETRTWLCWDREMRRSMASFAGWSLVGNLANMANGQGVNLLLGMFFLPAVNTARGIATQVQALVTRFITGFLSAINPQITKSYARGDRDYMTQLMYVSSKFCFFLLFTSSLPFIIEARPILLLWLDVVPDHTVAFFRLIIAACMIDTLANPINVAIEATGHIRTFQLATSGLLLLVIPISYVLLRMGLDPTVPFWVNLALVVVTFGIRLLIARRLMGFDVRRYVRQILCRIAAVAMTATLLAVGVHRCMPAEPIWWVLPACLAYGVICLAVIAALGLSQAERSFIIRKVRTTLRRH